MGEQERGHCSWMGIYHVMDDSGSRWAPLWPEITQSFSFPSFFFRYIHPFASVLVYRHVDDAVSPEPYYYFGRLQPSVWC